MDEKINLGKPFKKLNLFYFSILFFLKSCVHINSMEQISFDRTVNGKDGGTFNITFIDPPPFLKYDRTLYQRDGEPRYLEEGEKGPQIFQ